MNDKIEALNELRIDRTKAAPKGTLLKLLVPAIAIGAGWMLAQDHFLGSDAAHDAQQANRRIVTPSGVVDDFAPSTSGVTATHTAPKPEIKTVLPGESILEVSGHVTAQRMATVSAKTIGLINEVFVEEGIHVKKGQMLAKLDTRIAELDLKLAQRRRDLYRAEQQKLNAELLDAKRNLARYQNLIRENYSNQSEVDSLAIKIAVLEANLASTQTNVELNKIEVQQLQQRLDDHTILAPFSGVITAKSAQPGEIISPSSAGGGFTRTGICTIVDMSSLEIEVDVNESFLNKISEGQRINAELYAYEGWSFAGRVKKIVPTIDRAKATVRVRIEILELSERILPNMAVRVSFTDSQADAIAGIQ